MRGLKFRFRSEMLDITEAGDAIYNPDDYTESQALGRVAKKTNVEALEYESVRSPSTLCWALFTPKNVSSAIQTQHYEYVWNGTRIDPVNEITYIR